MNKITTDQWMALIRQLLPIIGTLATSMGIMTPDQAGRWGAFILTIAGPAMVVGSAVWAFIANSKASIVKSVAQMDETSVHRTSDNTATVVIHGKDLAESAAHAATPLNGG